MRWHEKMLKGMRLMKEACAENENGDKCWDCPFDSVCNRLMDTAQRDGEFDDYIPAHWREKRVTKNL